MSVRVRSVNVDSEAPVRLDSDNSDAYAGSSLVVLVQGENGCYIGGEDMATPESDGSGLFILPGQWSPSFDLNPTDHVYALSAAGVVAAVQVVESGVARATTGETT